MTPPLPERRYKVIYADPPWRFHTWSEKGKGRAAERHYPTLDLYEIATLKVDRLAEPDSAIFLWATAPMLVQALAVMAQWGFTYKSNFAWVKHKQGTGWWCRSQHELLLIGAHGRPGVPAPSLRSSSVFHERARAHSQKPALAYQIIESYYPRVARIELFARKRRRGWDAWGNEI
jgi:N6-adenosine-specific RNA methylase IME4